MRLLTSLNALKCIARFLNDSQRTFNLSYEWVQLRQMMKNDQHIGNVTIFFFLLDDRNDSEGQRAKPSHSNMARMKIFVRLTRPEMNFRNLYLDRALKKINCYNRNII